MNAREWKDMLEAAIDGAMGGRMWGFHHSPATHFSTVEASDVDKVESALTKAIQAARNKMQSEPVPENCCHVAGIAKDRRHEEARLRRVALMARANEGDASAIRELLEEVS